MGWRKPVASYVRRVHPGDGSSRSKIGTSASDHLAWAKPFCWIVLALVGPEMLGVSRRVLFILSSLLFVAVHPTHPDPYECSRQQATDRTFERRRGRWSRIRCQLFGAFSSTALLGLLVWTPSLSLGGSVPCRYNSYRARGNCQEGPTECRSGSSFLRASSPSKRGDGSKSSLAKDVALRLPALSR